MSRTINHVDPSVTIEDVRAALRALSTDGVSVNRPEWDSQKPPGYPTGVQIETMTSLRWSQFIVSAGLSARRGKNRKYYIKDKAHYIRRMQALCPGPVAIRPAEWNAQRDIEAGELVAGTIGEMFGGWRAFLTACDRKAPPPANRGRKLDNEKEEAEIMAAIIAEAVPTREEVQPLRLVASGTPRGVERRYCPASRSYYTVRVYGGGRFE